MAVKKEEVSFKDLTTKQLESLKHEYVENRIDSMSTSDLKKFAREVLELQVTGIVGDDEEREIWKEMKDFFGGNFVQKISDVININGPEEITISPEEEEFQKRLETLKQRSNEESNTNEDMW